MKFYIDTSVFGGYFDAEFSAETKLFFKELLNAEHTAVVSVEVIREIIKAHERVSGLLLSILEKKTEVILFDERIISLANKYVEEGALTKRYVSDALHIACATITKADVLVSWNFTHMVNFFRIKQYNEINRKFGYQNIDIRSPKEVTQKKNNSKAEESSVYYGKSIPAMQTVRAIRDELGELYWKNPTAYIEESNKFTKEFVEKHFAQKTKHSD
ncbi:MAG: PIN domain-containing protein [Bacteroidetes bacterium]|nr:PIN domain-containing protein [Bacteroidota bacterium]